MNKIYTLFLTFAAGLLLLVQNSGAQDGSSRIRVQISRDGQTLKDTTYNLKADKDPEDFLNALEFAMDNDIIFNETAGNGEKKKIVIRSKNMDQGDNGSIVVSSAGKGTGKEAEKIEVFITGDGSHSGEKIIIVEKGTKEKEEKKENSSKSHKENR